jgi:hypothetical protein
MIFEKNHLWSGLIGAGIAFLLCGAAMMGIVIFMLKCWAADCRTQMMNETVAAYRTLSFLEQQKYESIQQKAAGDLYCGLLTMAVDEDRKISPDELKMLQQFRTQYLKQKIEIRSPEADEHIRRFFDRLKLPEAPALPAPDAAAPSLTPPPSSR